MTLGRRAGATTGSGSGAVDESGSESGTHCRDHEVKHNRRNVVGFFRRLVNSNFKTNTSGFVLFVFVVVVAVAVLSIKFVSVTQSTSYGKDVVRSGPGSSISPPQSSTPKWTTNNGTTPPTSATTPTTATTTRSRSSSSAAAAAATSTQQIDIDPLYPFYREDTSSFSSSSSSSAAGTNIKIQSVPFPVVSSLENCSIQFKPPPQRTTESTWRKPLWAPSYPGSGGSTPNKQNGGGDLIKMAVEYLTGQVDNARAKPVKNYHMSMKNKLRRCKGLSETILCTQGHPIVPVEPLKQTSNFQRLVIVPVRNVATAFPTSLNDKAVAYHGSSGGQVDVSNWIETRDKYLNETVVSWVDLIRFWLGSGPSLDSREKNTHYYVGLFVPWEDFMDVSALVSLSSSTTQRQHHQLQAIQSGRGPQLVQRLGQVLVDSGYDDGTVTTSVDDATCIWYQIVKQEWTRQQKDMRMTYIPNYTNQQLDLMTNNLQRLLDEVQQSHQPPPQSSSLVLILKRYLMQIELLKNQR